MMTDDQIARMSPPERRELIARLAAPDEEIAPAARWLVRTRQVRMAILSFGTVVMVPWTIYLALSLPRDYVANNWDAVWVGFDTLEIVLLLSTAVLGYLRRQLVMLTAFALGLILLCDAWFDVLTSNDVDRTVSMLTLFIEVPLGLLLIAVALQLLRLAAIRLWALEEGEHVWDIRFPMPSDAALAGSRGRG